MPTGLTDVTMAIYVRGRWKSEKGLRGQGLVYMRVYVCGMWQDLCVLGSQMESGPQSAHWQADIERVCIVQYGAVVGQEIH